MVCALVTLLFMELFSFNWSLVHLPDESNCLETIQNGSRLFYVKIWKESGVIDI